jgi:hypothetical protein
MHIRTDDLSIRTTPLDLRLYVCTLLKNAAHLLA